ncbi:hypothetical protein REMIM1_PE00472 (plasmid) [Rhizobium etli bv. mimosae str. Mim1]|nr:hypothetical protein REMIM1_PE00472 [Rhizobium etli bv. mimosae str. Mim1]
MRAINSSTVGREWASYTPFLVGPGGALEPPPLPAWRPFSRISRAVRSRPMTKPLSCILASCEGCHRCREKARKPNAHAPASPFLALSTACGLICPGKIAGLADVHNFAKTVCGEFRFRLVDEAELHRLPSLAKKLRHAFDISRSCRSISFSRRNGFSSAAISSVAADLSAHPPPDHRYDRSSAPASLGRSRSCAISRCVRALVCAKRTASISILW